MCIGHISSEISSRWIGNWEIINITTPASSNCVICRGAYNTNNEGFTRRGRSLSSGGDDVFEGKLQMRQKRSGTTLNGLAVVANSEFTKLKTATVESTKPE
jgi:hypothetical protein